MSESFLRLVLVIVSYAVCFGVVAWFALLNASNRQLVKAYATSKWGKLTQWLR